MPPLPWDFPHRNRADWLQAGNLETGEVYLCYARGARVAIFSGTGFFVPKDDFGVKFLERQPHWNDVSIHGASGTVKPFERLDLDAMGHPIVPGELEPYLNEVMFHDERGESFTDICLYDLLTTVQRMVMKRWSGA